MGKWVLLDGHIEQAEPRELLPLPALFTVSAFLHRQSGPTICSALHKCGLQCCLGLKCCFLFLCYPVQAEMVLEDISWMRQGTRTDGTDGIAEGANGVQWAWQATWCSGAK